MVGFGKFARIAGLCVGFHPGTFHGYFFSSRHLIKFEFPARTSNKTCFNLHMPTITLKTRMVDMT